MLFLCCAWALAQTESASRTVIGPANPPLKEGADALMAGKAEEGVRLTRIGLSQAQGLREKQAGYSNLCAGYIMLEQLEEAVQSCNEALAINDQNWRALSNRALAYIKLKDFVAAERDIDLAGEIAPNSNKVKIVRGMLLDEIKPVTPEIEIDDRR